MVAAGVVDGTGNEGAAAVGEWGAAVVSGTGDDVAELPAAVTLGGNVDTTGMSIGGMAVFCDVATDVEQPVASRTPHARRPRKPHARVRTATTDGNDLDGSVQRFDRVITRIMHARWRSGPLGQSANSPRRGGFAVC